MRRRRRRCSRPGGIGDGRGLAAALAMGCVGVWVGTRFLASEEGGALDIQKQAIVNAGDEDTRRTTIYTGKTSRATYNRFHDLWEESGLEPLRFPVQVVLASAIVDMFNRAGDVEYVGPFRRTGRGPDRRGQAGRRDRGGDDRGGG